MNYLLLVCSDGIPSPEKSELINAQIHTWLDDTESRGVRKYGHPLAHANTAKTVRTRDDETLVSDGPFAESKEFVAGFDLIEADDLDQALEIAAAHPLAQIHAVEVREFIEMPGSTEDFPLFSSGAEPPLERLQTIPDGRSRYLMFMCVDGIPASDEEEAQIVRDAHTWLEQLYATDTQVFGCPLAHADTAKTVRVRDGQTLLSDGPFTEAKEFIAGIDIVDCASEAEAIEIAARHPLASYHRVEVRAFDDGTD